jgi:hypothetical protein
LVSRLSLKLSPLRFIDKRSATGVFSARLIPHSSGARFGFDRLVWRQLGMAKPQQTCGFCGGLGMTKQHIFGKRLLRLLSNPIGSHFYVERLPTETKVKKKDGNVWSKQLRRVCNNCNEGSMRILEESTFDELSHLIHGSEVIRENSQRLLASRLSQMAMTAALAIPNSLDAISGKERLYLKDSGEPPPYWLIFLCRADVPIEIGQYYNGNVFGYQILRGRDQPELGKSYIATFVLGKLCVHLLTRAPPNYHGYAGVRLARLWPRIGGDMNLSDSSLLDATGIHSLADSIRKQSLIDRLFIRT